MLNQIITILVISLIACIAGWYLGAFCQRRVDDREKERLKEIHRNELESALGAQNDDTEPFPDPNRREWAGRKSKIGDVVAANSHCVDLISDELKTVGSMLRGSLADLQEVRGFRTRIMESAIPAHDRFDRFIRSAKPPGDAIELVRDLITSLAEIEEQSVRVRSIAAEVNLLAVNASLEASRAGETGRGFSVFADCMRRLSGQSTDTIMDIYELVDKTRYDLEKIIQLLERNGEPQAMEIGEVLAGFGELENELARLDQITLRSISDLDTGSKRILELEYKVHALADSLSNGLAEMFDEAEFDAPQSVS
ncbi:MAG: methyl-accepting chemotaxis protein [Methylococcaceae bacterium]|nr:methyl-accepting chemotaxis protein [Methylococcaceae bacterium]